MRNYRVDIEQFNGIFPALVTPFSNGEINLDSLRRLVRLNLEIGVKGFYVCGTTAEADHLSLDQRRKILETVVSEVDGRATIIAHVGFTCIGEAIILGNHAKKLGVNAISAITPTWDKDRIFQYYSQIVDEVDTNMIVYTFPVKQGIILKHEDLEKLFQDKRVIGIKYTAEDLYKMERIRRMNDDVVIFSGYDEMFLPALTMGADGAIGSTYNFMAERFVNIREEVEHGNFFEAQRLQAEANDVIQALLQVGLSPGIKYALSYLHGIECGECLSGKELTDQQKQDLTWRLDSTFKP